MPSEGLASSTVELKSRVIWTLKTWNFDGMSKWFMKVQLSLRVEVGWHVLND